MKILKINYYICNGPSCRECEYFLPEFISKYSGELRIQSARFVKVESIIKKAMKQCPKEALVLL